MRVPRSGGPRRAVARPVSAWRCGLERVRLPGRIKSPIRQRHKRGMARVAGTGVTFDAKSRLNLTIWFGLVGSMSRRGEDLEFWLKAEEELRKAETH